MTAAGVFTTPVLYPTYITPEGKTVIEYVVALWHSCPLESREKKQRTRKKEMLTQT